MRFLDHALFTEQIQAESTREMVSQALLNAEQPEMIYYGHSHLSSRTRFDPMPQDMVIQIVRLTTHSYSVTFIEDSSDWDKKLGVAVACRDMTGRPRAVSNDCDFFNHVPMLTEEQCKRLAPISDQLGDVWLIRPAHEQMRLYENGCVLSLPPSNINVSSEGGGVVIWKTTQSVSMAICNCAGGTDIHHGDM